MKQWMFCLLALTKAPLGAYEVVDGLRGSFLYWGADQDEMGYAVVGTVDAQNVFSAVPKASHTNWAPGFRLEAGKSCCDASVGWQLGWTYLHGNAKNSAHSPAGEDFAVFVTGVSGFIGGEGPPFLTAHSAQSTWRFTLNELALDAYWLCYASQAWAFRPYVGLLGTSLRQTQDLAYQQIDLRLNPGEEIGDVYAKRRNNFIGVGPHGGLNIKWQFCEEFHVIADFYGAYLYGRFHGKSVAHSPNMPSFVALDIKDNISRGRPMGGGNLGIGWQGCCLGSWIEVAATYEYQYWWRQWRSLSNLLEDAISAEGRWGDLSLQGVTFSMQVSF